ncbi:hypothetical protein DENIS_0261 [Desulfonema ishimotonii]|uniref:YkgJ family cysteine cluster protein n=1 Tax=Desulfonema ishimotonii TaxID=45657 RepID=A0A401FQT7_9BACT|nr:YkgJ family cysteine cluster protein [Desulfonema ishimotonii]GBC59322.1 hypothetical protein DENIS_0261 [Desulfonema ishimotonii]
MSSDRVDTSQVFVCKQCGECCKGYGGTYVTAGDIEAIARHIGADPEIFVGEYCQMSGRRPVLAQGEDGYCIFRKEKLCSIHPVKPRMCRAWPFIESVLKDVGNWRLMASACPGILTDVPDELILRCVRQELADAEKKGL